jgi:hypothetical protein
MFPPTSSDCQVRKRPHSSALVSAIAAMTPAMARVASGKTYKR